MIGLFIHSQVTAMNKLGHDLSGCIGDCFNIEHKVDGNNFLWETIEESDGWRLQRDRLTKNRARILDNTGIQKGNGGIIAMREKMHRLLAEEFLQAGDVIGVSRGMYEHYAVYVGHGRVLHYAGEEADFTGQISIHEADFKEFMKDAKSYFVVIFDDKCKYPIRIQPAAKVTLNSHMNYYSGKLQKKNWNIFSAEETVKRAYSRIGERSYNLAGNNCEHFAMWCKTGISESTQVEQMTQYILITGVGTKLLG